MRCNILIVSWVLLDSFCGAMAIAGPITFDLRDPSIEGIDEVASFMLSQSGVTATISANFGVLNQTTGGFGINHPDSGDPTSLIDSVNAVEAVTLTFDVPVLLNAVQLSEMTTSESASLSIAGGTSRILNGIPTAEDVFAFAAGNLVSVGQSIVLAHHSGNGFSIDSFTVSAAVPEPSTIVLLSMGAIGLLCGRRRNFIVSGSSPSRKPAGTSEP